MSETIPGPVMTPLVSRMLREAFEGPPGPWTYFTDAAPGTGLFSTVGKLSAAEASKAGGPSGTTVAAHVQHLISSLRQSCRSLRGEQVSRDRSQSWTVAAVDDPGWKALCNELRHEFEVLLVTVGTQTRWDEDSLGTAFGAVAHNAYHLGSIRQRLPRGTA